MPTLDVCIETVGPSDLLLMSTRAGLTPQREDRMDTLARDLPQWVEWIGHPHSPEPGSLLFEADKMCPNWPVSQMAWQGLLSATDHLDLLNQSLINAGPRPMAQYTLARAALFASARTVWILAPEGQKDRRKHALWVAYEDVRYLRNDGEQLLSSSLGKNIPATTKAELRAQVQAPVDEVKGIARQMGIKLGASKNCEKIPEDTAIVAYAAEYVDPKDEGAAAALKHHWRAHSGHAHGLGWPHLLKPAEIVTTADGKKFRRISGDKELLAEALAGAWLLTQKGFQLYWERSRVNA